MQRKCHCNLDIGSVAGQGRLGLVQGSGDHKGTKRTRGSIAKPLQSGRLVARGTIAGPWVT
jgi:hypothetical protein